MHAPPSHPIYFFFGGGGFFFWIGLRPLVEVVAVVVVVEAVVEAVLAVDEDTQSSSGSEKVVICPGFAHSVAFTPVTISKTRPNGSENDNAIGSVS